MSEEETSEPPAAARDEDAGDAPRAGPGLEEFGVHTFKTAVDDDGYVSVTPNPTEWLTRRRGRRAPPGVSAGASVGLQWRPDAEGEPVVVGESGQPPTSVSPDCAE